MELDESLEIFNLENIGLQFLLELMEVLLSKSRHLMKHISESILRLNFVASSCSNSMAMLLVAWW